MHTTARNLLALSALIILPLLEAYCPRLAPDVISGKIIPCRYLCIRINFFEMPSIILSTERDGVLCSTLLLRRRGVCKNGGCIPFDAGEYKGTFAKAFSAVDKFASGAFKKIAPTPGEPSGPIVDTRFYTGGSNTAAALVVPVGSTTTSPPAAGPMTGAPTTATSLPFPPKGKTEPVGKSSEASKTSSIYPSLRPSAETAGVSPGVGSNNGPGSPSFPIGASPSTATRVPLGPSSFTAKSTQGSAGAASGGASGAGGEAPRGPNSNAEPTSLSSMYGLSS
uniref:Putative secreted peptide n=1 Tax=Rhipicephalus pulchellus TaxID=72859 RepID=L7M937_RHIPC